jgi:hypothetical protein
MRRFLYLFVYLFLLDLINRFSFRTFKKSFFDQVTFLTFSWHSRNREDNPALLLQML